MEWFLAPFTMYLSRATNQTEVSHLIIIKHGTKQLIISTRLFLTDAHVVWSNVEDVCATDEFV